MPQLPHVEELLKDYQDGKIYRRVGFHTYRCKVGLGGAMAVVFLGFPNENCVLVPLHLIEDFFWPFVWIPVPDS